MSKANGQRPSIPNEPEGERDWKGDNDGESIVGEIVKREVFHSDRYDRDFTVLRIKEADSGEIVRVPCARADLKMLIEKYDPQVGDLAAFAAFGEQDGRYRYAMNVARAGGGDGAA